MSDDEDDLNMYESKTCQIQWFHIKCMRIKKIPKGKWFCVKCKRKKKKKKGNSGNGKYQKNILAWFMHFFNKHNLRKHVYAEIL